MDVLARKHYYNLYVNDNVQELKRKNYIYKTHKQF